jgi:apolipoprotein N-acyltransferase
LFFAIHAKSPGASFKLGFLMGLIHYTTLLYWIARVMETYGQLPSLLSWGIVFLLVLYLSLYPAVFAFMLNKLKSRSGGYRWLAPFLWVALEYIKAYLLSGFPWEGLGYTQYGWLRLIQISDILGVYGLSALIVAVNLSLFEVWNAGRRNHGLPWKAMLVVALAVSVCLVYGAWRMARVEALAQAAPKLKVGLAQGNIDQSQKWLDTFREETLARYGRLSRKLLSHRPDLIIWPETALPFYFLHDEAPTEEILTLIRNANAHFLVGSPSLETHGQTRCYYNSAYLIDPSGNIAGRYDKVHLVPYGEYVPLKRFLPLGKLVEAVGDFESGKEGRVLFLDGQGLGILICFEVIFPELARAMVQNGARLLVTMTNDAWFGTSSAPYQHFSMAVFRAVENHRALARAANTGISGFIDPVGRRLEATPLFEEAVRVRALPLMDQRTFYARYGDIFAIACLLVCVVIFIGPLKANRFIKRNRKAPLNGQNGKNTHTGRY